MLFTRTFVFLRITTAACAEACKDECWVKAMDEELDQIEKNNTWELVPRPKDKNVIGTKRVFKNKLNENGEVVLVCFPN